MPSIMKFETESYSLTIEDIDEADDVQIAISDRDKKNSLSYFLDKRDLIELKIYIEFLLEKHKQKE